MSILGTIAPDRFLREFWQQRPLLARGTLGDTASLVDPDELAGLACEVDIESRIVIHDEPDRWRCEHGPFDAGRFACLPRQGWTLLVHGVDRCIPALSQLLHRFHFLPRWRIDDIMASFATRGGGVGPHFDYYDVFLIQARGHRSWKLGQQCDDGTALRDHPHLRLLEDFHEQADHELGPGDMLYVPPGLAHFGEALDDDCITLSVGFRAPSHAGLIQGMAATLAEDMGDQHRYSDPLRDGSGDPYLIDAGALQQLSAVLDSRAGGRVQRALALAFGQQVTEPRQPDLIEPGDGLDPPLPEPLATPSGAGEDRVRLGHNPASRFAHARIGEHAVLFVDGESHITTREMARAICHGEVEQAALARPVNRALLNCLLRQGSLYLLRTACKTGEHGP